MKNKEFPPIYWKSFGPSPLVGVDEVGRGCLAGPVYAAAVHLKSDELVDLVTDSKLLSEKRRDELAVKIRALHDYGIGFATVEEIDTINIHHASLLAMKRAVLALEKKMSKPSGLLLIDGSFKIPDWPPHLQKTVVKGDLRVAPISAASIVAKAARDQLMRDFGLRWPEYGFEKHKGYGSLEHRTIISKQGPLEVHRRTFKGVKEHLI